MHILARWQWEGAAYVIEDHGEWFRLRALGNVERAFSDTIGNAGRAEWLILSDAEKTIWAEQLLTEAQ